MATTLFPVAQRLWLLPLASVLDGDPMKKLLLQLAMVAIGGACIGWAIAMLMFGPIAP
jgi:hypothetical protein